MSHSGCECRAKGINTVTSALTQEVHPCLQEVCMIQEFRVCLDFVSCDDTGDALVVSKECSPNS